MGLNLTATAVFVALFLLVTWVGFVAARWRKADLNLLHEWGLGGRRFGTVVTWFLLGGDLYTAYTFIAVPALVFGKGAMGFFAVPYTILVYPVLYLVFPRLWAIAHAHGSRDGGGLRARPLRQPHAGARRGGDGHRGHDALHRAAARRHGGGDRRARFSPGRLHRSSPAHHRFPHPGGLHLYERPARARADRRRQGRADLHHHHRCGRHHPGQARRLRRHLRQRAAEKLTLTPPSGRQSRLATAPTPRWRSARRSRCSSIRTP